MRVRRLPRETPMSEAKTAHVTNCATIKGHRRSCVTTPRCAEQRPAWNGALARRAGCREASRRLDERGRRRGAARAATSRIASAGGQVMMSGGGGGPDRVGRGTVEHVAVRQHNQVVAEVEHRGPAVMEATIAPPLAPRQRPHDGRRQLRIDPLVGSSAKTTVAHDPEAPPRVVAFAAREARGPRAPGVRGRADARVVGDCSN